MTTRHETFAIFAAKIFSDLYEEFPLPAELDRKAALAVVFDFDALRGYQQELSTRKGYREIVTNLVNSDNPHLTDTQRAELQELLRKETGLAKNAQLTERCRQLEKEAEELSRVWDGTLSFLEFEGYLRCADGLWQLTEKGFGHLRKRFVESKIEGIGGTLIQRIREQLSDPSKIGAQILLQIFGSFAGGLLGGG
jgi:hypothetical protein